MVSWTLACPSRVSIKSWADDELGLVFDAVTGDTHLLDHSAIEILQSLEKGSASAESLAEQLADRFLHADLRQISDFITTSLLQLRDIGLVFDTSVSFPA